MKQPVHAIATRRREMTPERFVGIGFVVLLHVIALWAILTGLVPGIVKPVEPPPFVVDVLPKKPEPVVKTEKPKLPLVDVAAYDEPRVVPPDIDIETTGDNPIKVRPTTDPGPTAPGVPDTSASGIMSTHTTPPYPMIERRLEHQGTVRLRLTISPQGVVTAAEVVQSSGFAGLDEAAVSWVMQHWKYKPAVQAGAPVSSTTVAAVVFNIRTGG